MFCQDFTFLESQCSQFIYLSGLKRRHLLCFWLFGYKFLQLETPFCEGWRVGNFTLLILCSFLRSFIVTQQLFEIDQSTFISGFLLIVLFLLNRQCLHVFSPLVYIESMKQDFLLALIFMFVVLETNLSYLGEPLSINLIQTMIIFAIH